MTTSCDGCNDHDNTTILEEIINNKDVHGARDFALTVINSLDHPFFVIDANDYSIKLMNRAAKENGSMFNTTCFAFSHQRTAPCDSLEHPCPLQKVKITQKPYVVEHVHFDKEGREQHVEVHAHPILDKEGNVTEVIEYCLDISSRKKAEQEQRRLEEKVNDSKHLEKLALLASGVAHDFNNILAGILGNLDLMEVELASKSPVKEYVSESKKAIGEAAELVNQLLAYSGKGGYICKGVELNTAIEKTVEGLAPAIPTNITLQYDFEKNLPAINADPSQIKRIISNLVTNAIEAVESTGGALLIRTGLKIVEDEQVLGGVTGAIDETLSPGRYVMFEIFDTGCGMTIDTKQKAFDPFFTTKSAGRGLGLSAAIGIAKSHQGIVQLADNIANGSTVRVILAANNGLKVKEALPS
ncbi:ATP-binding protein [Oligoflexia bacterium]|nr:ATP-binding protein [Oligoflexia bacterium]